MSITTDPRHEFVRVNEGQPNEHYKLESHVYVNGQKFTVSRAFPFTENEVIMKTLEACEVVLARAVGEQLIRGNAPRGAKK